MVWLEATSRGGVPMMMMMILPRLLGFGWFGRRQRKGEGGRLLSMRRGECGAWLAKYACVCIMVVDEGELDEQSREAARKRRSTRCPRLCGACLLLYKRYKHANHASTSSLSYAIMLLTHSPLILPTHLTNTGLPLAPCASPPPFLPSTSSFFPRLPPPPHTP